VSHPASIPVVEKKKAGIGSKELRILREGQERIVRIGADEPQSGLKTREEQRTEENQNNNPVYE
jgi:hypothetical protein